jgi:hypothetical protein
MELVINEHPDEKLTPPGSMTPTVTPPITLPSTITPPTLPVPHSTLTPAPVTTLVTYTPPVPANAPITEETATLQLEIIQVLIDQLEAHLNAIERLQTAPNRFKFGANTICALFAANLVLYNMLAFTYNAGLANAGVFPYANKTSAYGKYVAYDLCALYNISGPEKTHNTYCFGNIHNGIYNSISGGLFVLSLALLIFAHCRRRPEYTQLNSLPGELRDVEQKLIHYFNSERQKIAGIPGLDRSVANHQLEQLGQTFNAATTAAERINSGRALLGFFRNTELTKRQTVTPNDKHLYGQLTDNDDVEAQIGNAATQPLIPAPQVPQAAQAPQAALGYGTF